MSRRRPGCKEFLEQMELGGLLLFGFIGIGVILGLLIVFTSVRPNTYLSTFRTTPTVITGPTPLTQNLTLQEARKLEKPVPIVLPWSITSPPTTRPPRAFYVQLPLSRLTAGTSLDLTAYDFIQQDPQVAENYPVYTVFVLPPQTPTNLTLITDKDSCTYGSYNINCGILPSTRPDGTVNLSISPFNISGPYQLSFAIQNRASHTVFFLLNKVSNEQFEIPAGSTAFFNSTVQFWNVLLYRQNNPSYPQSPFAQLNWTGAVLPDRRGVYPYAPTNTYEDALAAGAAEAEAANWARAVNS